MTGLVVTIIGVVVWFLGVVFVLGLCRAAAWGDEEFRRVCANWQSGPAQTRMGREPVVGSTPTTRIYDQDAA